MFTWRILPIIYLWIILVGGPLVAASFGMAAWNPPIALGLVILVHAVLIWVALCVAVLYRAVDYIVERWGI